MIPGWVANEIKNIIAQVPAITLLGARQVGKTTIAKTMAQGLDFVFTAVMTNFRSAAMQP
jgi:uncharacterized protein